MSRFKMAFKAALVPAIVGIVALVVGVVFIIVSGFTDVFGLLIGGIVLCVVALCAFAWAYGNVKNRLNAICPECQKFMGNTDDSVEYEFTCDQAKENYDKSTHQLKDYTFNYTCKIVCPHCGSSHMFEYKTNAKTVPKANEKVNNYLKGILKLKK